MDQTSISRVISAVTLAAVISSPQNLFAEPTLFQLELQNDFQTTVKLMPSCPLSGSEQDWSGGAAQGEEFFEIATMLLMSIVLKPFIQAGIQTIGAAIQRAGDGIEATAVTGRDFGNLYKGNPRETKDMGIFMNPKVHCVVVIHGGRDIRLESQRSSWNGSGVDREQPIMDQGKFEGWAFFEDRNQLYDPGTGDRLETPRPLGEYLRELGHNRVPDFYGAFEIQIQGQVTEDGIQGAPLFRLLPREIFVSGRRQSPSNWDPIVTLTFASPERDGGENWVFDLAILRESLSTTSEAGWDYDWPPSEGQKASRSYDALFDGTLANETLYRKLPALSAEEAAAIERYNELVELEVRSVAEKTENGAVRKLAEKNRQSRCDFNKSPYKAVKYPGTKDGPDAISRRENFLLHSITGQDDVVALDVKIASLNARIAKRLRADQAGETFPAADRDADGKPVPANLEEEIAVLEAAREQTIVQIHRNMEFARLFERGAGEDCNDDGPTITPPTPSPALADRENKEKERIKNSLENGMGFIEVSASVVWSTEPNVFLQNLGKAIADSAEDVSGTLANRLITTEAERLEERQTEITMNAGLQTAVLNAIGAYEAASAAADADPSNINLIIARQSALISANASCALADLQGAGLARCGELPADPN